MSPNRPSFVGLVEDSDEDHAAFVRLARKEAPNVRIVRWASAEEFLGELAAGLPSGRPDVLVADLNLPGIDGAELTARLRREPIAGALSVFVLSGSDRQADIDRCYASGANAYLTKPGSASELRALVQMLFRTMATFRAATPSLTAGASSAVVGDPAQDAIDEERLRYEAELRADRDRERQARERAEVLQRLTARLANASDAPEVTRTLVEAVRRRPGVSAAEVVSGEAPDQTPAVLVMPDPFGDGTIAMLPLADHGARHGALRAEFAGELCDEDEAFLHSAVAIATQAYSRVARVHELAQRARVAVADLPAQRWWADTVEGALTRARRAAEPLSVVVVLPRDQDGYDAAHGVVRGDARLLAIVDAWRAVGHDLYSPSGGERWAVLIHADRDVADAAAADVLAGLGGEPAFVWGSAQWDRRENAEALLFRAVASIARDSAEPSSA